MIMMLMLKCSAAERSAKSSVPTRNTTINYSIINVSPFILREESVFQRRGEREGDRQCVMLE